MGVKHLAAILSCVHLLLVQGSEPGDTSGSSTTIDSSRRVLNGRIADPKDFRFHVYVDLRISAASGAVITNYFVLTAAHVLDDIVCTSIGIFPSVWTPASTTKVSPVQCWSHEKHSNGSLFYDISLLRTSTDLLKGDEFKSIPLPAPGTTYPPGTHAIISGWGRREGSDVPSQEGLIRGDTYVIDWDTCYTEYTGTYYADCLSGAQYCLPSPIPKRSFCIQGRGTAPAGVCYGDSGGPVVIEGVLAGVVAGMYGDKTPHGCAIGKPSLITNVVDFLPWIYHIIEPGRYTSEFLVTAEFH